MRLSCVQCGKRFLKDDLIEMFYSDNGIYFFCCKECGDKWADTITLDHEFEDLQQSPT
jgi:hypothetical protein